MENKVNLTAVEIYNKDFTEVDKGYNTEEVNAILDLIIEDYQFFENFKNKLNELQILNIDLTEKNENLNREREEFFEKSKSLSIELEEEKKRYIDLQKQLSDNEAALIAEKEKGAAINMAELETLKQKNHELNDQIIEKNQNIKDNQSYISNIELKLNALEPVQTKANELANAKATLEQLLEEKNQEILSNTQVIDSLNSKLTELDSANNKVNEYSNKIESLELETSELKTALTTKDEHIDNLENQYKEANDMVNTLENRIIEMNYEGIIAEVKEFRDEIIRIGSINEELSTQVNELTELNEKSKEEA
ncbi:MAG: DivIVA domain-containing protein [Erysipelotrichaceae bacterium]